MQPLHFTKKVSLADVTVRDGFQHEERFISTDAKLWCLEELILCGFKKVEVTNLGNPRGMPQFRDADDLFRRLYASKRVKDLLPNVELTAVTIREKAVDRAIALKKEGYGPTRILQMVSTSASHMFKNSGLNHEQYWKMTADCIQKAHDAGIKFNGTVSTIWGCPIEGPTDMQKAVEFTKHYLDLGADDIEHADHDGSAPPDKVYEYFCRVLDAVPDPSKHIAHFHVTRGWGTANVLAALQAGITNFECSMGGLGGQPANFLDDCPVAGTGSYYYKDAHVTGLVPTEDVAVMMDEMGIELGLDIDRLLSMGKTMERIIGGTLRSQAICGGRILK